MVILIPIMLFSLEHEEIQRVIRIESESSGVVGGAFPGDEKHALLNKIVKSCFVEKKFEDNTECPQEI
ncbi:hypothetical protein BHYA_0195g00220 [Botrytis hyacinthi]|uniref:Uncharacterized protein n=1 Tax=Botrytis hyacinthi TaxID=278943 RepID=A0A4Z1GJ56_9HELO|nr:hypothetical protein BHYA_0195g00220 [Botrytis hyacinthi]